MPARQYCKNAVDVMVLPPEYQVMLLLGQTDLERVTKIPNSGFVSLYKPVENRKKAAGKFRPAAGRFVRLQNGYFFMQLPVFLRSGICRLLLL